MHRQDHIDGVVCDDGVRVRCEIVEELVEVLRCGFCGDSLLCGEGPERREHREIDGACIVEENSYEFLDGFCVGLGEEG